MLRHAVASVVFGRARMHAAQFCGLAFALIVWTGCSSKASGGLGSPNAAVSGAAAAGGGGSGASGLEPSAGVAGAGGKGVATGTGAAGVRADSTAGRGGSSSMTDGQTAGSSGSAAAGTNAAVAAADSGGGTGGTAGSSEVNSAGNAGAEATGGAPVMCPASTLPAGETTRSIDVGGTTRTYLLHVPNNYDGRKPVPLVLDFHGLLLNGALQRSLSGYAELSDQEGFIVAFPDGIDNAWNVGPCCTTSRTVDDVAFARALVDKLESDACIDPKRVYATGFSMGGGMSHYLACHAADVFAAVTPASFDLLTENEGDCKPARPITVMSFRGTADSIVPYKGGESMPPNGLQVTIHFLGAEGTFQKWAMLDGCTGSPTMGTDGCQTYSQCEGGVEVTLCSIEGGEHAPGDAKKGWAMLKKHPMP